MSNNTKQPSPLSEEHGQDVEMTLMFPQLLFGKWKIGAWTVKDRVAKESTLGISFKALEPADAGKYPEVYHVGFLFREVDNPLTPLWQENPGMRATIAVFLLTFPDEVSPELEESLVELLKQEFEDEQLQPVERSEKPSFH